MTSALLAFSIGTDKISIAWAKTLVTEEEGDSPKEDIVKNPLKPPGTTSPRATL
jgi:hypothetical protein